MFLVALLDILMVADEERYNSMDEVEKWDEAEHSVIDPKWLQDEVLEGHLDFILCIRGKRGILWLNIREVHQY